MLEFEDDGFASCLFHTDLNFHHWGLKICNRVIMPTQHYEVDINRNCPFYSFLYHMLLVICYVVLCKIIVGHGELSELNFLFYIIQFL